MNHQFDHQRPKIDFRVRKGFKTANYSDAFRMSDVTIQLDFDYGNEIYKLVRSKTYKELQDLLQSSTKL